VVEHLLEMAGDHRAAHAAYQHAARRTTSVPERRHLITRAAHLPLDDDGLTA
jgi:predicted RNA polymerase sigma factor